MLWELLFSLFGVLGSFLLRFGTPYWGGEGLLLLRIREGLGKQAHYACFGQFGKLEMTLFLRIKYFLYKS